MIEALVFAVCTRGSWDACQSAYTAYYKQSGIERAMTMEETELKARYPIGVMVVTYAAMASSSKFILNLGGGKSFIVDAKSSILTFKGEF